MSRRSGRQKLQNRHRPLLPGQLRRRFIRERQLRRVEFEASLALLDPDNDYYQHWDNYDYCNQWGDNEDLIRFEFDQELIRLLNPGLPLVAPSLIASALNQVENEISEFVPATGDDTPSTIDRLRILLQRGRPIEALNSSLEQIRELLRRPATEAAVVRYQSASKGSSLIKNLCWFAQFWIRDPASWSDDDETSLVEHLLVRRKIPSFLYRVWHHAQPDAKWLCWFILLAQGKDLKAAADVMKWNVNRSMIPFLYGAPSHFSPLQACLFAEVRRLGGTEQDARRLLANPAFEIDPTADSADRTRLKLWYDVTRWMIKHGRLITDDQAELILPWALHEWAEAERLERRFVMKGRTLRSTLERAHEYRDSNLHRWTQYQWDPHGWNWELDDAMMGRWSFVELTSGIQLVEEGEALHHCVATYAPACAQNSSAIVSIRRGNQRLITAEVNPMSRNLIQARGTCNRNPTSKERAVIRYWLANIVRESNSTHCCAPQAVIAQGE